jgi:hypothetical protein
MDFSTMPVDEGVVDSPPEGRKRKFPVHSPSPLKKRTVTSSTENGLKTNPLIQRRLYGVKETEFHASNVVRVRPATPWYNLR